MKSHNTKFLMVCAAALMSASSAYAQSDVDAKMEWSVPAATAEATSLPVPSDTVPPIETATDVPAGAMAAPAVTEAQADMVAPAPQSEPAAGVSAEAAVEPAPTPILDVTAPEPAPVMAQPPITSPAQIQKIVTLRDAVAVGVLTSPATETVENNRRATDEELKQAKALYLPSLDMRADTGFQSINSDPDNSVEGHSDLWRSQASLTLTQMLFDGFDAHFENERQKHRVRSASHRVRETAEFQGLDVIEAYLNVLRQRELYAIAEENLKQHSDIMAQIQDSVSAGRSTQADMEQTKARLNAAEAQISAVTETLRSAENSYRRKVGDVAQPDIQVPTAPSERLESNINEEVKQILTHSPTLDIKEADVNVAEAEREGTKSTFYPQVDFQAGTSIGDNLDGTEGRTQDASALVIASWNLYRGGGDTARARELVYRHAQAKNERNEAARAVEEDARNTWANMMASRERTAAFTKQAEANAMVVSAYKDQFNLDRRTLLDVLDSQNEWFVSRSNAINNSYLEMFAVYRLLALRGELLPTLGVAYPKEANPADKS